MIVIIQKLCQNISQAIILRLFLVISIQADSKFN